MDTHTDKPMPWTRERPTKPGWYWFRWLKDDKQAVLVRPAKNIDSGLMFLWHRFEEISSCWICVAHIPKKDAEWQGPITPQGEPEEEL